jgi:hypothetical protein
MPEGQNGIITKGTKMYRMQMNASTTVIQMEKITHLIMIEIENVRTKVVPTDHFWIYPGTLLVP